MDNPTHMVVIETAEGNELRRQGPMNLGRAYKVKHRWENSPEMLGDPANVVRIIDSPTWDFENDKEITNVDPDEARRRKIDDWRRGDRDSSGNTERPSPSGNRCTE